MLSRRQLLVLGAGLLPSALIAGCNRGGGTGLLAVRGDLPAAWASSLPRPWSLRELDATRQILAAIDQGKPDAGLVQLSDGWASSLERRRLQPFEAESLLTQLTPTAAAVSRLFGPASQAPLAFPWAVSPWVLALRNRPDLLGRASQGWDVLLDPSLRGQLVLPSSPRVSISLMGYDLSRVRRLRANAMACDEANGLNLLLRGGAAAAVLPQQRLIPLLRQDPRLLVVLPASGAPLSWQLLLRPANSQVALPVEWLQQLMNPPLLPRLLAAGWVPPLPRQILQSSLQQLPARLAALLLPPETVWQRCWSLPPLNPRQRLALQNLWDAAIS